MDDPVIPSTTASSNKRSITALFQKVMEEAGDWPVECHHFTDAENQWQGLILVDRHLEESKKKILDLVLERLSDRGEVLRSESEAVHSCAVSAEERTLLFDATGSVGKE